MTSKLKAKAYRLAGGSQTAFSAAFQEKRLFFESTKKQTEKLYSTICHIIDEYDTTGMNKFEKVGDAFSTYGARFEDSDATASLENARETFNAVGKLHRDFKNTVAENVTSHLKQWIDGGGKDTAAEIKTLETRRDELDIATNKLRGKEDNTELQELKKTAESAFEEQLKRTEKKIDEEMIKVQRLVSKSITKFMELESKLFKDVKTTFKKGAEAIKC
uniref:BAR domain-containing protein n=2 Tax=Parascaris univalens TaxID=6257 RepID=A0A915CFL6_PARUN